MSKVHSPNFFLGMVYTLSETKITLVRRYGVATSWLLTDTMVTCTFELQPGFGVTVSGDVMMFLNEIDQS